MPFRATVFDHSRFLDGFSEEDQVIAVHDAMLFQIAKEVHNNSYIHSLEEYLVAKVASQGWSIEFSQAGLSHVRTDPHVNNVIYQRWEQPLEDMLRHGLRYGFCAIRYIEIADAPKDDFDTIVPRVMDPVSEYSLRFRTNDDGTREYMAYERTRIKQDTPIPHTRVFVFFEPQYDGAINSPIQKCFVDLQRLRAYWNRHEERDYRNTHPAYLYEYAAQKESLVDNSMPPEAIPEYDQQIQHQTGGIVDTKQMQKMYSLDVGNSFIQQRFQSKREIDGERPDDLYHQHWNPELNRYTDIPISSPWEPQRLLDQNINLARGIPTTVALQNFDRVLEDLVRNVANVVGIPAEVLFGGKGNFAADIQFSAQQLNTTVQRWHRRLEPALALVYLDIYSDVHLGIMREVFRKIESNRSKRRQRQNAAQQDGAADDGDGEPKRDGGLNSVMISDAERVQFEKAMIVSVHFNDNPTFDYNVLKLYKEDGIISHADFQRLALTMAHLPASMALTQTQIEQEAKREAKVREILEPQESDAGNAGPATTKRKADSAESTSSKKRKTSGSEAKKKKDLTNNS